MMKLIDISWFLVVLVAAAFVTSASGAKRVFTNDWAVEVFGGPAVANAIAKRHGFENRGQASTVHL